MPTIFPLSRLTKRLMLTILCTLLIIGIYVGIIIRVYYGEKDKTQINISAYKEYVQQIGKCTKINATIISLGSYECSKSGCECTDGGSPREQIPVKQYDCFNLVISYGTITEMPVDACINVDESKISEKIGVWNNYIFKWTFGLLSLAIVSYIIIGCIFGYSIVKGSL